MKTTINYKKAAICGVAVYLMNMIIGNVLWLNPLVSGIFGQYAGHPSMKPMEYFGGTGNWVLLNAAFGTLLQLFFIIAYVILYTSLPGKGWRKGVSFGMMLFLLKAVPEAFNQWMIFTYPSILIVIQLINSFIDLLFFSILLAALFEKFNVIEKGETT
jgi:hypothetical protein